MEMDGYHVREATSADRQEVLDVHHNVYDGLDYLPVYYEHYMSAEDITPFVLLHENKIIGFTAAHILDDGLTVVPRTSRVNPAYEGRGLYRYLDNFVAEWAKSRHVTTKAFMSADQNANIFKPSFRSIYQLVHKKHIVMYTVDPESTKLKHLDEALDGDLEDIPDSVLETYITSDDVRQYLFPYDRVVADSVPFKLLKSNIPKMRGPRDKTVKFSDVQKKTDKLTGCLSFGTIYRVKRPDFLCTIEIYGFDESSLRKHATKHLKRIIQKANGVTLMIFFLEKRFQPEVLDDFFSMFGVTRKFYHNPDGSSIRYTEQFLFEKQL